MKNSPIWSPITQEHKKIQSKTHQKPWNICITFKNWQKGINFSDKVYHLLPPRSKVTVTEVINRDSRTQKTWESHQKLTIGSQPTTQLLWTKPTFSFSLFSFWALALSQCFTFFFKKRLLEIQKHRGPVAQTRLLGHEQSSEPFHSDTHTQRPKPRMSSLFWVSWNLTLWVVVSRNVGSLWVRVFLSPPIGL